MPRKSKVTAVPIEQPIPKDACGAEVEQVSDESSRIFDKVESRLQQGTTPLVQDKIKLIDYNEDEYVTKMNAKTGYIPGDTDESGLDKAYKNTSNLYLDKDGTLYVSGTKGGFFGSEWIENYITMGVPLISNALGLPMSYAIEDNERYKELDEFMKSHPGQVKNLVGHSKGSAVIHAWMKNNPEFTGQSRLYATPYEDVFGKESIKNGLEQYKGGNQFVNNIVDAGEKLFGLDKVETVKGETRIANNFDPATLLDRSANRYDHGDPLKYISNGGPHDYHEGIARFNSGFDKQNVMTDKPGTDYDQNYSNISNDAMKTTAPVASSVANTSLFR